MAGSPGAGPQSTKALKHKKTLSTQNKNKNVAVENLSIVVDSEPGSELGAEDNFCVLIKSLEIERLVANDPETSVGGAVILQVGSVNNVMPWKGTYKNDSCKLLNSDHYKNAVLMMANRKQTTHVPFSVQIVEHDEDDYEQLSKGIKSVMGAIGSVMKFVPTLPAAVFGVANALVNLVLVVGRNFVKDDLELYYAGGLFEALRVEGKICEGVVTIERGVPNADKSDMESLYSRIELEVKKLPSTKAPGSYWKAARKPPMLSYAKGTSRADEVEGDGLEANDIDANFAAGTKFSLLRNLEYENKKVLRQARLFVKSIAFNNQPAEWAGSRLMTIEIGSGDKKAALLIEKIPSTGGNYLCVENYPIYTGAWKGFLPINLHVYISPEEGKKEEGKEGSNKNQGSKNQSNDVSLAVAEVNAALGELPSQPDSFYTAVETGGVAMSSLLSIAEVASQFNKRTVTLAKVSGLILESDNGEGDLETDTGQLRYIKKCEQDEVDVDFSFKSKSSYMIKKEGDEQEEESDMEITLGLFIEKMPEPPSDNLFGDIPVPLA